MPTTATQRVCLVTGGAGFIGSHLVDFLLRRGERVIAVDDLSTGRMSNLQAVDPDRFRLIRAPVRQALGELQTEPIDEIYHLAAAVGVRLVIEQPVRTIETNVLETCALLAFAANGSPRSPVPTLIASSSEIYGKSTRVPFREDDDVAYGPTIYSRWSYACSKAIDEYLALAYHQAPGGAQGVARPSRPQGESGKKEEAKGKMEMGNEADGAGATGGLPVVIGRFFNTIGPRQVGRYGMVVPRFVAAALAGEPIEVYGDGQQTRCFCDVRDVVGVLPRLLGDPACYGRVFNVGSDELISIDDLAHLVRETLGSGSPIVYVPYDEAFGAGFDDLRHRQPDLTRLREATGFSPRIPLAQTVRDLAGEVMKGESRVTQIEEESSPPLVTGHSSYRTPTQVRK